MTDLQTIAAVVVVFLILGIVMAFVAEAKHRDLEVKEAFEEFDLIMRHLESCRTKYSLREVQEEYYAFLYRWMQKLSKKEYDYYTKTFADEMRDRRTELTKD